ncbi:M1 family metallopeptidase [Filimonas effusa]|uniref:M1 family peptidase n=1 Tax=Filimonas effusa TaxID=2508721 RepID=A0A4Q1DCG5_9BACT|nr:M1 family metallopeptidase [Filimonas effusa]RXK86313.1 M1 family peptidase [Filimonas effusa]
MSKTRFLLIVISIALLSANIVLSQTAKYFETPPEHTPATYLWWNLLHYKISITPDYSRKFISGSNEIRFVTLQSDSVMRIRLQQPMHITAVTWKNKKLAIVNPDKSTYLLLFPSKLPVNGEQSIIIDFEGIPAEAHRPPFDNGWIWQHDQKGNPWISVACEGSGASIWLPCKEAAYDEPDNGIEFNITVPDTLNAISNGRFMHKVHHKNNTATWQWKVLNPINSYNIIPYIGKYASWHSVYNGLKGKLHCNYWVLNYNLTKARKHFRQTDTMLQAFEHWMGAYPFYEDGYKLVEAPMPGMEHQSAIAYGNEFENGYHGKDFISGSGWGLKWDFILVHESGHEWFGNSLTAARDGESWIHEGFTKYLETLYTSFVFGTEAGNDYATGTWKRIKNDAPVIGHNTSDVYYKGSAMLHMIRQIIGNPAFRDLLTGMNRDFYHQAITTSQILAYFNHFTQKDFSKVFEQYLRTTQVPALTYAIAGNTIRYRWENCVPEFDMPVKVTLGGNKEQLIYPSANWKEISLTGSPSITLNRNFFVTLKKAE